MACPPRPRRFAKEGHPPCVSPAEPLHEAAGRARVLAAEDSGTRGRTCEPSCCPARGLRAPQQRRPLARLSWVVGAHGSHGRTGQSALLVIEAVPTPRPSDRVRRFYVVATIVSHCAQNLERPTVISPPQCGERRATDRLLGAVNRLQNIPYLEIFLDFEGRNTENP